MVLDVTLLTKEQIWGDEEGKGQLQVMRAYGTKTGMSDLAIVLGGISYPQEGRVGSAWSASPSDFQFVRAVDSNGSQYHEEPCNRYFGVRPVLPASVTSSIKMGEVSAAWKISEVDVVEYGEYPQTIATKEISKALESAFSANKLKTTGKKYTFDGEQIDNSDKTFSAKKYREYQHNGKHYIRVEAKPYDQDSILSNGHVPKTGEVCWIEVQPIEWLKDPTGVWVARQALFSGVQFDNKQNYDGDFAKTGMKKYLNKYFAKEMQVSKAHVQEVPDNVVSDVEDIKRQREAALKNGQGM